MAELSFLQYVFLFFVFSFLGWVTEVTFIFVVHKRYVNTGMLNGPICPIYGFGLIFVLQFIYGIDNIFLVFIGSTIIATVVELVAGALLFQILHRRWWDYSNMPYNFHGYICLRYSLMWGVGGTVVCFVIMPIILKLNDLFWTNISFIPTFITIVFIFTFLIDIISTSLSILKLRSKYEEIDNIAQELRSLADDMSKRLVENVEDMGRTKDELKYTYNQLKEKYNYILNNELSRQKKFFKSFPNLDADRDNLFKEIAKKLRDR
ncbi:Uncharacterized membrane protein [Anaerosphaera aminiphila DSM 21120]|uniref:Uncharacterized membrane protein n=1 Tax=Anaerosphaera aminiphila DSM 21120 TaxID=1120995 RepID=A0A1M5S548_9FIRM|nr:putative ABC transporter permease [Anaerosphaera aminiphila]SHH33093.1 Uncharacterized membrane protein [Anaerosphaera aminiphila DSM 21120]